MEDFMTKTTKATAKAAKVTTAKPVAKKAASAVTAKAVSVKAKAVKATKTADVEDIEGPVTLTVAFKKDLDFAKRLERAAHKHGTAKVKSGICDMKFVFKRKSAFTKAVDRIKERFGADVTIAIAGAAA